MLPIFSLKRFFLSFRILPFYTVLVFIFIFVNSGILYQNVVEIKGHHKNVARSDELILTVELLLSKMKDIEIGQRGFTITGDEAFLDLYQQGIQDVGSLLATLKADKREIDDDIFRNKLANLEGSINEAIKWQQDAVEARRRDVMEAFEMVRTRKGKQFMDLVRSRAQEIVADEKVRLSKRAASVDASAGSLDLSFIIGSITNIVLILLSYIFIRNWYTRQQQENLRLQQENWLQGGLATLNDSLRGVHVVQSLGENILAFLARYLGAQIATFYSKENESLKIEATYAMNLVLRDTPTKLGVGQGLVGEAVRQNRTMHIKDLPPGYLRIVSSTGQIEPKELLIVPLTFDGEVQGVIEMGTFNSFTPEHLEMMRRAQESIGISLNAAQSRRRLRALLEETQRQAEELQTQQETLTKVNRELAQHSRYKSEFLANMSHEIRTPLGAVLGYAELLRSKQQNPEEQARSLQAIIRNGQQLLRVVDDVLDLSKIEADRIELEVLPIRLQDFFVEIEEVHAHIAKEKGLDFRIVPEGMLPSEIECDAFRLKQILNNIIGNALKFTAKGYVSVHVRYEKVNTRDKLIFSVKDTGIGMEVADAQRIFQPFLQADSSTKRQFGGTGLGLVISRRLARLMGGDVVLARTHPGEGSEFVVSIDPGTFAGKCLVAEESFQKNPDSDNETKNSLQNLQGRLKNLRVLVVDDTTDVRVLIGHVLNLAGAKVDLAESGREAIIKAAQNDYDVVLMDIQMPGMDGYEATQSLRASGFKRKIVALTAHVMKDELEHCLKAGCDTHMGKPVDWDRLVAVLSELRPASQN